MAEEVAPIQLLLVKRACDADDIDPRSLLPLRLPPPALLLVRLPGGLRARGTAVTHRVAPGAGAQQRIRLTRTAVMARGAGRIGRPAARQQRKQLRICGMRELRNHARSRAVCGRCIQSCAGCKQRAAAVRVPIKCC